MLSLNIYTLHNIKYNIYEHTALLNNVTNIVIEPFCVGGGLGK